MSSDCPYGFLFQFGNSIANYFQIEDQVVIDRRQTSQTWINAVEIFRQVFYTMSTVKA